MSLDLARTCPECGAELPPGTVPGQCPHCLLGLGLAVADAEADKSGQKSEVGGQSAEDEGPKPTGSPVPSSEIRNPFADYELLEEIARGGMGVIYKARQKSLDRIVALKMMLAEHLATKEQLERFRTEAQAAAQLHHPHIVAIHEVGEHAGQHFFSMDYVPGRNLAQVISDLGFRISDFKRSVRWMRAIAEAVHHAHERGVLHRDLKPSNILIDEEDQPRITDFGLAKRLTGGSELTLSGQVLGSPNYLSPEQAAGTLAKVGRTSDVYALGAILYHLLTGRPPFQADTLTTLLRQVVDTDPVPPRRLNPSIPRDLETVCLKCLEKEAGRRYGTARMVAEELDRFLEGQPLLARPAGRMAKGWRWCQRNPRLALATGAALLSLLLGLAGVTWEWRQAGFERARAEAEALLARRHAYAADMNLVQQALVAGELGRARELLNRHRPSGKSEIRNPKSEIDLSSWEWRYLWARCQGEERFTLHQYSNAVWALAFSPDGKWLAVRGGWGSVALWDSPARRLVTELPVADVNPPYKALAFSPVRNLLACANYDTTNLVSLWDLGTQKETARLPHSGRPVSLSFSPDAQQLATLADDGTVRVWDLATLRALTNFSTEPTKVPPEKRFEAMFGAMTYRAQAKDGAAELDSSFLRPGARRGKMDTDHYGCVLFSPDGRWLALGEARPRIRLWDRATGTERPPLKAPLPADGITALAFSPDGRRLAAGFGFGYTNVQMWDLETRTPQCLVGHTASVAALAFSPDGRTLASVGADQDLLLWDLGGNAQPHRRRGNIAEIWALAWSPDGKDLVTGAKDGTVRYWDPNATPTRLYERLDAVWFSSLTYLPDGKSFLTANVTNGEVVRWDATTLARLEPVSFIGTGFLNVDLTKEGRWLAMSRRIGDIHLWDFLGRQFVTNLAFPQARMNVGVWFSPRDRYLLAAAYDSEGGALLKAWEAPTWREVELHGIDLANHSFFDMSYDERTVAVGYRDGTAAWWDFPTKTRHDRFACGPPGITLVQFSPDGKRFATAGLGGMITLRDVATRRATPVGRGYASALHTLWFSPDSQRLITTGTSPQGLVKFWDVVTGRDVATLPGEPGFFCRIGFSPDGTTLFASSKHGTTLFWRAPSWAEIEAAEKKRETTP